MFLKWLWNIKIDNNVHQHHPYRIMYRLQDQENRKKGHALINIDDFFFFRFSLSFFNFWKVRIPFLNINVIIKCQCYYPEIQEIFATQRKQIKVYKPAWKIWLDFFKNSMEIDLFIRKYIRNCNKNNALNYLKHFYTYHSKISQILSKTAILYSNLSLKTQKVTP